ICPRRRHHRRLPLRDPGAGRDHRRAARPDGAVDRRLPSRRPDQGDAGDRARGRPPPGVPPRVPVGSRRADARCRRHSRPRAVTTAHIAFDDVSYVVDDAPILRGVTTRLTASRTAVIGANGSGKSTFARMINGLRQPTSGSVRVLGLDPAADAARVRSRVGFVFTNPEAQILMPTPAEDLALSLGSLSRAMRTLRVEQILEQYGL